VIDVAIIDEINILQATMQAMEGAVNKIPGIVPDYMLIDGDKLPKVKTPFLCSEVALSNFFFLPVHVVLSIYFDVHRKANPHAGMSVAACKAIGARVLVRKHTSLLQGLEPAIAEAVVGGDKSCHIIAAASIIAKVIFTPLHVAIVIIQTLAPRCNCGDVCHVKDSLNHI
jgi:ribonuclease HII